MWSRTEKWGSGRNGIFSRCKVVWYVRIHNQDSKEENKFKNIYQFYDI